MILQRRGPVISTRARGRSGGKVVFGVNRNPTRRCGRVRGGKKKKEWDDRPASGHRTVADPVTHKKTRQRPTSKGTQRARVVDVS